MHKLSESLQFHEKFLQLETEKSRTFYTGRWIILAVLVRFVNQVVDKLNEEPEQEVPVEVDPKTEEAENPEKDVPANTKSDGPKEKKRSKKND